ncbi:MAG TPA: tetratricopeptide repeat protein [Candidatus Sulfotelmatobacter sp.]|nr:tetratricopeptide repeat protein [Candidatus Sulfotelmatobacter sp.]
MSRSIAVRLLPCLMIVTLFAACTRDPNVRKQKYFDSGDKYFAQGKYREAVIQYSNAIQIDPRFAQAHYQLSQAYLKMGDSQRAYPELSRTVELAPDNYRARTDLANLLVTVRNPDGSPAQDALGKAKVQLDELRAKRPNAPETHEAWANYYAAQNNLGTAIQEINAGIMADPGRSESYLLLALLQLRSNQPDEAKKNFQKATQVDPKAMNAQLALGGFYQSHDQLPEAENQFHNAISIDPKNPAPRAALVRLLMQEGKKDEIESFLRQTKKDLSDNQEGYRMLGDYYFATGDLDKAVAEYGSLYRDHPKDPQVRKNYVQLLILKNRLDEASKLDNEILKTSPHDVDALVYKGQIQLRQNDAAGAVQSLQSALQNDPENAVAHYQLGIAYAQQHDTGRAEQEWQKAVSIRPDLTDAQKALASVEMSRGEIDAVMQTAQQIITSQPYSADGYLLRCVAELARQKYPDAQHDAEEAMKRAPQAPAPYFQLGNVQLAQKHFAEAEKWYQQSLDKNPAFSEGLSGLMNTYFAQKQFDKAIAAANAQIANVPNNSNFYDLLGTALFNGKKDYPAAEAALRKAVDLDKNNTDALEKLGKVQVQEGSADQALALYLQSIKDNPREVRFYILAGELYEAKQNWDQAKAMYQQALSLSPDQPLASNNLAYVILQQGGNVDVAMGMAQTARRGMPNSPNAADTLGWAYYHKGIYESAISQFQEALRLNEKNGGPDDAVLHYHLGLAYQKSNQNGLARQQLEKAVKLRPDNNEVRKALAELRS